jgi:hypothetical protein
MDDVTFVPPEQWDTLPVQPPAGKLYRRMLPLMKGTLWAVAAGVAIALIDSFTHDAFPKWIAVVPLALGIAQSVGVIVLSALAVRPYCRDRKLGYTTWRP